MIMILDDLELPLFDIASDKSAAPTLSYTILEPLTPTGPQYRKVSVAPPRTSTADEIPIIDLSTLDGDWAARQALATKVKAAAENTGFFYVFFKIKKNPRCARELDPAGLG